MVTWIFFLWDAALWLDGRFMSVIYIACIIAIIMVVYPWIVRLAVRANFSDFHLVAVRQPAGAETRAMSYLDSLSVVWLISWRLIVVANLIVIGSWLLLRFQIGPFSTADQGEPGLRGFIELLVDNAIIVPLLYFWLVPAAFRKRYAKFVLEVRGVG